MTVPSYEQLAALVAAQERIIAGLQARIAEQDARIAEQDARIAELEAQLKNHPGEVSVAEHATTAASENIVTASTTHPSAQASKGHQPNQMHETDVTIRLGERPCAIRDR